MTKLPITQTVITGYQSLWNNCATAVKVSWLWFILYYSFTAVVGYLAVVEQQPLLNHANSLAKILVTAIIAVAWHRLIILKEYPTSLGAPINKQVAIYLLFMILAMFVAMGPTIAANYFLTTSYKFSRLIGEPIIFLGLLAIVSIITAVVLYRFALILPAIAIDDKKLRIRDSWRLTQNNTGRLLAGGVLSFLPVSLIIYVLNMTPYLLTDIENLTLLTVFWNLLSVVEAILEFVQMITVAAFLSFSYLFFCPNKRERQITPL